MSKYWRVFSIALQQVFQYRMNILMFIVFGFMPLIAMLFLWLTLFKGKMEIQGFTIHEMITYLILAKMVEILLLPDFHWSIHTEIRQGELSKYLVKPLSYPGYWFARNLAKKGCKLVIACIPMLGILLILRDYLLPITPGYLPLFLLSLLGAFILYFLIYYQLSLLTLWFVDVSSFFFTADILLELLSGTLLPLNFLPGPLQEVLQVLPFSYLVYFPMNIYLGKMPLEDAWAGFLIQGGWIVVFILTSQLLWHRGLKRYDSVGA